MVILAVSCVFVWSASTTLALRLNRWMEPATAVWNTADDPTSSDNALVPYQPMIPDTSNSSLITNPLSYLCFSTTGSEPLNIESCTDAVRQLDIRSTTPTLWGLRNTGQHYQVYLPRRFISADGSCFVEPILRDGHESSLISQQNVATAGIVLIQRCAAGDPSESGVAQNIGGDNRLRLALSGYQPQVHCFGRVSRTASYKKSCQDILDTMDVSEMEQKFGPPTGGVDVVLPLSLKAGYLERCAVTVQTTGGADVFSWIEVWEAAAAINAMCIRAGKQGTWNNLGSYDRLSVSMTHESILGGFRQCGLNVRGVTCGRNG